MSGNEQTPRTITGIAGTDLNAQVYRFVAMTSSGYTVLCTSPGAGLARGPFGVLTYPGGSGQPVGVSIQGACQVWAAATLSLGDMLSCNSVGGARVATSGDTIKAQYTQLKVAVPGVLAEVELCPPFTFTVA
jgi:hypothetical protein